MLGNIFRKFRKKSNDVENVNFAYGNAEILKISIGTYDQGAIARVKLDIRICGAEKVIKNIIWLVPIYRMNEFKPGQIISIKYNPKMDKILLV